jgi:hypothetical protein
MLTMFSSKSSAGLCRRDFFRVGALGMGGLTLADLLRLRAQGAISPTAGHKAVIMIFLYGGPSHIDLYDLKPEAPPEIRGEFKPIQTSVPGLDIGELMPLQAQIADKLALVRGLHFEQDGHFADAVFRGTYPDIKRPVFGSVVSRLRGGKELPPYVALGGEYLSDPADPAYLGMAHRPFTPTGPGLANLGLQPGITLERLDDRKALLGSLDTLRRDLDGKGSLPGMDAYTVRALDMISSSRARDAFDLSREPDKVRNRYGRVSQLLLARRLVEAGVSVVTLSMSNAVLGGHWDTHSFDEPGRKPESGFSVLRRIAPLFDRLLHSLVTDLYERGLDKDVAVVAWGEFGRTPKVNKNGGRDHWAPAGVVLFSGGGLKMGQVVGATDARGERSRTTPYRPCNVLATLYQVLGIDLETTLPDYNSRPMYLLDDRKVIAELQ